MILSNAIRPVKKFLAPLVLAALVLAVYVPVKIPVLVVSSNTLDVIYKDVELVGTAVGEPHDSAEDHTDSGQRRMLAHQCGAGGRSGLLGMGRQSHAF